MALYKLFKHFYINKTTLPHYLEFVIRKKEESFIGTVTLPHACVQINPTCLHFEIRHNFQPGLHISFNLALIQLEVLHLHTQ